MAEVPPGHPYREAAERDEHRGPRWGATLLVRLKLWLVRWNPFWHEYNLRMRDRNRHLKQLQVLRDKVAHDTSVQRQTSLYEVVLAQDALRKAESKEEYLSLKEHLDSLSRASQ